MLPKMLLNHSLLWKVRYKGETSHVLSLITEAMIIFNFLIDYVSTYRAFRLIWFRDLDSVPIASSLFNKLLSYPS